MGGIGSLWEALGWFERFWKALQGFARFCEAMCSFERLCEVLDALDGFVMLWEALALEGFGKLLKSLGKLWEAVASA